MVVLRTINAIHNYNVQTKKPRGDDCTIMRLGGALILLWNGENAIFIKTTTVQTIAQNRKGETLVIVLGKLKIKTSRNH